MRLSTRVILPAAAILFAACSRSPAMDEDMKKDLDAASAGSIEMAPRARGTTVVSAVEQNRPAEPVKAPVRQVRAPARTPEPETPQPTPRAAEPTAVVPQSAPPRVQPPPPGGYKSVNEVIRNAPFPIKPATATKRPA
jgi:hypothetical protein